MLKSRTHPLNRSVHQGFPPQPWTGCSNGGPQPCPRLDTAPGRPNKLNTAEAMAAAPWTRESTDFFGGKSAGNHGFQDFYHGNNVFCFFFGGGLEIVCICDMCVCVLLGILWHFRTLYPSLPFESFENHSLWKLERIPQGHGPNFSAISMQWGAKSVDTIA